MKPPLCRQLTNNEKRMAGDVGAIRKGFSVGNNKEAHGFIYVSDKVAYSKNGFYRGAPYALQTLDKVFEIYHVPKNAECRKNEIDDKINCENAVSYFRCKSMEDYLKEHRNAPLQLVGYFDKIVNFERCLEKKAILGAGLPEHARKNIVEVSEALVEYLKEQADENKSLGMKDEEKNFLIGSLQLRLTAIATQLADTDDNEVAEDVSDLADAVAEASAELSK